jgi:hypothetical protein
MREFINLVEGSITAPEPLTDAKGKTVFLAGSIDMGKAQDWQSLVTEALLDDNVTILNPRRKDWDSTWKQDISNPEFNEQVTWELDALDLADLIVIYFDPKGQAPITLMELGLHAPVKPEKMIVCCPEGFWRRGNVQIVCERFDIEMVDDLDALIDRARKFLN